MEEHLDIASILEELRTLEPIFHTHAFGVTLDDFALRMVDDYWEIGASGTRYDRAFILKYLASAPPVDAEAAGSTTSDHAVRRLAADTFLLTYRLQQKERMTLRSTLWRRAEQGWQILFHQGTVTSSQLVHESEISLTRSMVVYTTILKKRNERCACGYFRVFSDFFSL